VSLGAPLPVTRRTVLGGALAGVAVLSGCGTTAPATTPEVDPDDALVDQVVAELDEVLLTVTALAGHRKLAEPLGPFLALHEAHRAALPEGVPTVDPPLPQGSVQEQYARLLRRERESGARLAGWAVEAESGTLARLLASMSAGIAAHVTAAPAALGDRR
jgi:hypothetical protein